MPEQNHTNSAALMAKPALSFDEFFVDLLGLPASTAEEIAKSPDRPAMFLLGRRRYIRTCDAIAWIDQQAERKPYFPRRNNTKRFQQATPPAHHRSEVAQ